jgi:hypothetical protein
LITSDLRSNSIPLSISPALMKVFRVDEHYLWYGENRYNGCDLHR